MIGRPGSVSSACVKSRPSIGMIPNTWKKFPDTYSPGIICDGPFPGGVNFLDVPYAYEAIASNVLLCCRQSKKSGNETSVIDPGFAVFESATFGFVAFAFAPVEPASIEPESFESASDCGYSIVCSETIRSASGNGNARNNTPLTTLKIAVVAPIPNASVNATIKLNRKFVLNCRTANPKSCRITIPHNANLRKPGRSLNGVRRSPAAFTIARQNSTAHK